MNDNPLFSNKLAAAILVVLLVFLGLPVITHTFEALSGGHHDHHYEESNPFGLAYKPYEELVGVTSAPQTAEVEESLGCLLAAADISRGQRGAALCASCHSFEKGGANGTGPNLWNVVNRDIASVDGYGYTAALSGYGGAWTYENLDQYLYDSGAMVAGTAMAQKIRKSNKRADILAYLGSLSDSGQVAFPECVPPATETETAEADEASVG